MIFTALGPLTAYRMHLPRWASEPTSGAGAARHGGRANRPGISALYLALEADTALQEYQQLSSLMPPGTLVSYELQVSRVVDFRAGYEPLIWSLPWHEFDCDWRQLWFDQRATPPSWMLGDDAIAASAKGIAFRSRIAPGGTNLVIYTDTLDAGDRLSAYDPAGVLPKNQDSWR